MFNTKEHYKMYKKGKTWIFASIVTATLALGAFGGQTAHADTSDAATAGEETATKESVAPAKQVTLGQQQSQTPADAAVKEDTGTTDTTTPSDGAKDPVAAPAKESETTPAPDATGNSDGDTADKNEDADLPATPAPDADKTGSTDGSKVMEKPDADAPVDQANNEITPPTDKQPVTPVNTAEKVNPRLRSMAPMQTPTPAVTAAQPVAEAEESIDQWMPNKTLQQVVLAILLLK